MDKIKPSDAHHKFCKSITVPLYLGYPYPHMGAGHTAQTPNGTATLIRHQGRCYAVTCRHIAVDALENRPGDVPRFHLGALVLPMNRRFRYFPQAAKSETAQAGQAGAGDRTPDIAFVDITNYWSAFERADRQCVDLDSLDADSIDWTEGHMFIGAGWMDEHKDQTDMHVRARLALACAPLKRAPSLHDNTFRLQCYMDEPVGYFLSGISGGPLLEILDMETLRLVGIVYEGFPGSGRGESDSFMGNQFLALGGQRLTAVVFAEWLRGATAL